MAQTIRAYILETKDWEPTGRSFWDNNCELLEVMKNGDALRIKSSYFLLSEIALRIPDCMNWGEIDGMKFNFCTWVEDGHRIFLNY
ncbi:MAG: hypothetical protein IKR52_03505 [Paludibacteraceae bacterium]|nr:hypothetical protein [Paludibacteraceae bacterium]